MTQPAQEYPETRLRLLHAAGEQFAARGYDRTSLRDICRQVDVNVALVKYYFGDKAGLHAATLAHCHHCAPSPFGPDMGCGMDAPAETRLRAFVRVMVRRARGDEQPRWCIPLLNRELIDPGPGREEFLAGQIKPLAENLLALVAEIVGPDCPRMEAIRCALSIVGQCLHHRVAAGNIALLYPGYQHTPDELDALAAHIAEFSLAGLVALRQRLAGISSPS